MDQIALVNEQIEVGARFLAEFRKYIPVQYAFWLYETENEGWRLYVASEQITNGDTERAYGKLVRAARAVEDDPWFNEIQFRLVGVDHLQSQRAAEVWRQYPRWSGGHYPADKFGLGVEGVYLYPQPSSAASTP